MSEGKPISYGGGYELNKPASEVSDRFRNFPNSLHLEPEGSWGGWLLTQNHEQIQTQR